MPRSPVQLACVLGPTARRRTRWDPCSNCPKKLALHQEVQTIQIDLYVLVLLIGGIPIAMPTVLSVTLAIDSHRLSQQGAITKRMAAIEEIAGMDVLCYDKTGTLTLNHLTVDKNLIEVFSGGMARDMIILLATRASRVDNQDAIDMAIKNMLSDTRN